MCVARRVMDDLLRGLAPQRFALWVVELVALIVGGVAGFADRKRSPLGL